MATLTKKDMIKEVLLKYGTSDTKHISMYIKREFDETVTPSSVGGQLRSMVGQGLVGSSKCGCSSTMYWYRKGV